LGVLDVLFVSGQSPLKNVRVTILDAQHHEVDSSPNAFRMAWRDAGKQVQEAAIAQIRMLDLPFQANEEGGVESAVE
jgi:translation elongation factor EF-G